MKMYPSLVPSRSQLLIAVLLAAVVLAPAAGAQTPLSFAKSFSPDTIGPGSVSTLTFTITNNTSSGARSLAFTDNLPAAVTIASPANVDSLCSGTVSAPDGGGTISFSGNGIGPFSSCTISVDVTSSTPGTHTNVSGTLTSDIGNGGTATADLTVATDRPGFSKSFSPSAVFFNGRSTLTFTIDNTLNAGNAYSLSFVDNLPAGMTVASPTNASTTCGSTLTATAGGSVIALGFPYAPVGVAAGASCTVSVDVIGGAVGVLDNISGDLTSTPGVGSPVSSGKASASLTVSFQQLSLTKSFTDDPVVPGGTVTLQFTIVNLSRGSSAGSISFDDDLEAVLSGLAPSETLPKAACGGTLDFAAGILGLTGGSLGAGASCTFSVTLAVPSAATPGAYTNTTTAVTSDIGDGNAATDQLFVSAVPTLTKSFLTDPVGSGDPVTLEFTITNTSTTDEATDIAFSDNLDAFISGITVTSSLPASNVCGTGSTLVASSVSGDLTLFLVGGNLAASDSCTFSVDLLLPIGTGDGNYVNTTSDVTATVGEESVTGGAATDTLTVVEGPDLLKEFIGPAAPGGTATMRFTLFHRTELDLDAFDIGFTDDLNAVIPGLASTSGTLTNICGAGSELSGTTFLTFSGGTVTAGDSCTFDVILQVPSGTAPGTYNNTTSNVVATVGGEEVTDDPGDADLQITGLTFTKEFTDDPAIQGDTVTLEFFVENTSGLDATNIEFSDSLNAVLSGLASTSGTLTDVCGSGSQISGTSSLSFTGGNLLAGESCTFSVTLQVPAGADSGVYSNVTSSLGADIDGTAVVIDPATDSLEVANSLLTLSKEFVDDPVAAGDTVTLEFIVANLADKEVSSISFTDDLAAALSGLVATGLPANDVCGTGSEIDGTGLLTFSGGSLAAGASCSFTVTLQVPGDAGLGSVATNTTSEVTGKLAGTFNVVGDAASDDLQIDRLAFSKAFSGEVEAGDVVTLTFTIENPSTTETVDRIGFSDDLDAALSGLAAIGLPESDVCGTGSEIDGTSFLTLTNAILLPGGSCTIMVDLQVPAAAASGLYTNETSELVENGLRAAAPATAVLTVVEIVDDDGDGVLDNLDVCPGTAIPEETVPSRRLGTNRFALVDDDGIFDTTPPNGQGPSEVFTIEDTAGCSCEQIIAIQGLGQGHVKFGCSLSAMRDWVDLVNP